MSGLGKEHADLLVQHHGSQALDLLQETIEHLLKTEDCTLRSQIVEVEELRQYIWTRIYRDKA
jgi:hypothetical protein